MTLRHTLAAVVTAVAALAILPGCAVTRGQSTVGDYIDDATLTTQIKARYVDANAVDAASIKVETLNGEVLLSGFAKNTAERDAAERIARGVKGVRVVRNEIKVRG